MAALSAELELLKQQHTLQADELQATVDAAQKAKDEHVLSLEETQKQMEQLTGQLAENVDRCSKLEMDLQTTNHKLAQAAQCMSELQEERNKVSKAEHRLGKLRQFASSQELSKDSVGSNPACLLD